MNAEKIIIDAMIEHGTPNWVAYVPISVRKQITATRTVELREKYARLSESVANKRDTKHDLIDDWCANNVFAEVTLAELAAIGNCSKEFVRQKTIARPDIFRRISHTTYEIRDPHEDRNREKGN
jgi:hypothetical protein